MLYDRPEGVHHPVVRVAAGALLVAMLVLGFLGYPPKVTAQTVEWRDPVGLPPLDGTNGTGRAAPVPLQVDIDGSFPVSVTLTPTLVWKNVPTGVGQVTFMIRTLAGTSPKLLWSRTVAVGTDRVARATVPAGEIAQGRTYAWTAESSTDPKIHNGGPFGLTVDVQRTGSQPSFAVGAMAIAEGTGELVYTYHGPSMKALAGPIGWTLVHRPTNTPQVGLPEGWRLVVTGSTGWDGLRQNDDGSVTLSTSTGVSVTYTKRGQDQWEPQVGRFNTAGETTLLSQNADGTFSATDGNRTVTVFSRPSLNAQGRPIRIWSLDSPAAQQTWRDGRLHGLTDPVTDNSVAILYGGEDGCTTTVDPGFVKAPAGMLCGAIDATGNAVMLEYVAVGSGVQIGRIVSGLGAGMYASSSDIGWDDSGRIVETRAPLAAAAVATDVVGGLGPQDTRVLTQVGYDTQGRVASVTTPAGLIAGKDQPAPREERAKVLFTYAPFTVKTAGVSTPAGFDTRDVLDPVTLRVERKIDESGNAMTYTYDASGNVTRVEGLSSGTVAVTHYNRYGKPVEQIGPTKGLLTSPTAPRTTTAYDQDEQGRDWKGLAVRYWSNAGFNGAPAGGSTGPIVGGAVIPSLQFNWTSSPAGGSGPWAARLSGVYEAATAGSYRFETQTSAKLWVDGRLCATTCTQSLGAGDAANLQIDVVSADGAAAGVKVMVTGPDGKQVPMPTAQLRPNYGLATSSTVRENDGGGVRVLVTKMVYDPTTTQLLKTISPSGATISRTYEPYDPANGQWGRSTSVTDASGKTTTSEYYAKDAVASDCSGQQVDQSGQIKSVTLPGGQSVSQVAGPDGGALSGTDGSSTVCTIASAEDLAFKATTTGLGSEATTYSFPTVSGNPLLSAEVTVNGGKTLVDATGVDTNGNVWKTVDAHGTSTVRQWDAVTGNLTRIIETAKDGQQRTTDYTYAPSGQVATVTVNGHLLLTNVYASDGSLLRTELGNGAVQTFELDANDNARKITTRFPDGTTLSETMTHSPSGRLLARTLSGPSGTSTYTYDYNADGRLIDTKLSGTIPTTETRWQNVYTGPDGLNGNRASETTTRADGSQATAAFTYGADNRLLSSTDPKVGQLEYDAAGRATKIGAVGLSYDAAGHLLSAGDGNRTYAFSDAGTTTTLTQTVDGEQKALSVTTSGESLILGADNRIDAQIISPAQGLQVVLDQNGAPTRWVYNDSLGNGTWSSPGDRSPTKTQLYSPDGEEVGVVRTSTATPIGLALDAMGWRNGSGATNLRLSTPITIMGDRSYTPDGGRWLQTDPTIGGAMNAYEYAIGDPINLSDATGNAPSRGAIIGMVAAAVVGVAIGSLTFGIGTAAVASYGFGALAAQVAVGAVSGLICGAVGEVVQQSIDGGSIDWARVGIAAGWGAAAGAAFAGVSAGYLKMWKPRKEVRALGWNPGGRDGTSATGWGYEGLRQQFDRYKVEYSRGMFTKGSWKKDFEVLRTRWKLNKGEIEYLGTLKGAGQRGSTSSAGSRVLSVDRVSKRSSDSFDVADLKDILAGKPSVSGNRAFVRDSVQRSQQKTVSNALSKHSSSGSQKEAFEEVITGSPRKSVEVLDEVRASQRSSYWKQKQFSEDIEKATDAHLTPDPDAQDQFTQFLLSQIKWK